MKVASGVALLVGLLIFASVFVSAQQNCFKCGSPRATECQGNLSRLSAELCRIAQEMLDRSLVSATEGNLRKMITGVRVPCMAPPQTRRNCPKSQYQRGFIVSLMSSAVAAIALEQNGAANAEIPSGKGRR